jgi:hypothetical protein
VATAAERHTLNALTGIQKDDAMYIPPMLLVCLVLWIWGTLREHETETETKPKVKTPAFSARRHAECVAANTAWDAARAREYADTFARPTVWGPGTPWKTEAQYRTALQVARDDKARRLAS